MKKNLKIIALLIFASFTLSSCATLFGGPISTYQKTKPAVGEPQRDIRVGALVADVILFWPAAVIDFATGAIYKPENPKGAF